MRSGTGEDLEQLWRIDQACFPPEQAYSRLELSTYMRRSGAFTLIAETDAPKSLIAGFIVAEANRRGQGHIVTIDVVDDMRRHGVGSKLLEQAEQRLTTAGCHSVYLETAVNNASALLFYKRHGYFVEKTITRYYNGVLDALLLRKDLHPRPSDS
ncbi:MAG TPA: N-acetyltransferase [Terriglobales bacterium]|nr:N-acetyltransferase [Terriglobales bacterium]